MRIKYKFNTKHELNLRKYSANYLFNSCFVYNNTYYKFVLIFYRNNY